MGSFDSLRLNYQTDRLAAAEASVSCLEDTC